MTRTRNNNWILLLLFFGLTGACIVFSILCISNSYLPFIKSNKAWLIVIAVALLCFCCTISIALIMKGRDTFVKAFISGYVFLLFCLILIFTFQKTGFFQMVNTPEGLQSYLERSGLWMPILYIVVQYLQVIILPIPTIVSTVAGLALFGPFQTLIFSFIGIVLGSLTAFFVGRKLGDKAVAWIVGRETLEKWQKKLKRKDKFILTIMFILPLFPDDILCFIAGLSSMSNGYFLTMIFLTRFVGIAGTCYSFDFIPFNSWWGIFIWFIIFAVILFICFIFYKYIDKIHRFFKKNIIKKTKK